ncbi:MAG: triose-phosphate isomerase [Firmicutes bacterium]|nr:triose-phosphate isomerase [Bacillota bacterium]
MMRRVLLAANWKMFKTVPAALAFGRELLRRYDADAYSAIDVMIFPTALALWPLSQRFSGSPIQIGAQNLDLGTEGAMTGALSGYLWREAGAEYVLVGHSERRQHFGEGDELVAAKVQAAISAHLHPILCVGETAEEREREETLAVMHRQIGAVLQGLATYDAIKLTVAYEPVWAIGSGKVPTARDANGVAAAIRHQFSEQFSSEVADSIRILYGGSVSPKNIREFAEAPDIDGALVGGASLDVETMVAMMESLVHQEGENGG